MLQTNNKHVARIFMEWWISSYKNPFDIKCIPLFTGIILINKKETQKKNHISKGFEKNVAENWLETAYIKIPF